jgi:hypothetical protein
MSKDILQAMMPEVKIYEADMTEGGHPTDSNRLVVSATLQFI